MPTKRTLAPLNNVMIGLPVKILTRQFGDCASRGMGAQDITAERDGNGGRSVWQAKKSDQDSPVLPENPWSDAKDLHSLPLPGLPGHWKLAWHAEIPERTHVG